MGSPEPFKVLVFSKTTDYRHASIPAGITALRRLAEKSATSPAPATFAISASEDSTLFTVPELAQYRVIVLLHTSGDFLNGAQLDALKGYVRSGGGVVGIHGATVGMPTREVDAEGWFGRLLGAEFSDHPKPQTGVVRIVEPDHSIVARRSGGQPVVENAGPKRGHSWEWFDEWYNFRAHPRESDVRVLLAVDEGSYEGGKHGADHPIAWCHEFEGARSFYTALGHFDEAYQDETFMQQILNGILWTARLIDKS